MPKKTTLSNVRQALNGASKSTSASRSPEKSLTSRTKKTSKLPRLPDRLARFIIWFFTSKVVRVFLIGLFVALVVATLYLLKDLPSPRRLTTADNFAVSTQIFDRNGKLLYEIYADENRTPIALKDLPPHVWQAAIAIEDKNFYKHFGFDISGIVRATIATLSGKRLEGGSTITQQLVKNALLTNERSLQRKIKEAMLSVMTEALYSKEEILEMYLNYISYGGTSVGIEAASQAYFDKHAKDLTIAEAALLAGLPQAPSRYSPFGSQPETAKNRQKEVVRRMREDGYINPAQAASAETDVLTFALSRTDIQAPHFVFFVRDMLYDEYGEEKVERGGLRVYTTLDLDLHTVAQASLSAEIDNLERHKVSNGAALIVKPNTGEILSMIGSRDYFDATHDGKVNVTLSQRQPGSSIKPIMYATTFQQKTLNPGTILIDAPTCFEILGQKPYCPKNYDGSFKGAVTIRESLGNSLNIPAVKAIDTVGVPTFMEQATAMGITSWTDASRYGLSLSLGGGEVRMIDLVQAFSVLANQGVKVPLTPILRIEDYKGNTLRDNSIEERVNQLKTLTETTEQREGDLVRVMDRAPAYLTSHIMQDNNARIRAFGSRSELVIKDQIVSAKTGTTNDLRDNWTVGFTPEYLVMTWVGNNDNTPMNRSLVSGITGAAPIFNDLMTYVLQGKEAIWQEKPPDVLSAPVCEHGMPIQEGESCQLGNTELYWKESKPSLSKIETKQVWIDPRTGLPPPYGEVIEGLVLEERTLYSDPVTELYCANCNRPVKEDGNIQYEQYTVRQETQVQREERRTETQITE
ncbi:transglycosylase domain-containing protein [Candidatus Woesebacteria bacterium]|nr:transglycosylase domain-containing protein [Candidatus Woesebacteria bacterium]